MSSVITCPTRVRDYNWRSLLSPCLEAKLKRTQELNLAAYFNTNQEAISVHFGQLFEICPGIGDWHSILAGASDSALSNSSLRTSSSWT